MLKKIVLGITSVILLSSCDTMDTGAAIGAGLQAIQAISVNNEQMIEMANLSCQQLDNQNKVVSPNSKYQQRINNIARKLNNVELLGNAKLNYKVYDTKDLNAFAMPNGCVRIYSGLMDKLTDDEIAGVIGHEIGHVALEHTKRGYKVALASAAAITAVGGAVGAKGGGQSILSSDKFQSLLHGIVNSQFSQLQESQADSYGVDLMKKNNINPEGLATGLLKIEEAAGQGSSVLGTIFSDHPNTKSRVDAIYKQIGKNKKF